jgi:aminopeptidase-like protein
LERVARHVIPQKNTNFREGPFGKIVGNDEMVFNGPGINVPTVSISRWPYPEYHTSDDNLSIISEEKLIESKNVIQEIINILENDYTPKRLFKGPVFLSRYGLWVDWRINKKLNEKIEQIMLRFEGDKSVFDISEELGMEFNEVLNYVNKFYEKSLIAKI